MICGECECNICANFEECGAAGCGNCDPEHPHRNDCEDFVEKVMTAEDAIDDIEAMQTQLEIHGQPRSKALDMAIVKLSETEEKANFFGMTVEAERRVMKNAVKLIREIVNDCVFGCDSGNEDWREYFTGYSDELDEKVATAERPSDFCYKIPSDEWLFQNLISYGTTKAGKGSAYDECRKIGKILNDSEE